MHIQPNSGLAGHGHVHKIKAPETQPLDIIPTDDGGVVETEKAPAPSAGSFSDRLTPETAFNAHVLGREEQAEGEYEGEGEGEVNTGPGKPANSPAHIARQLIAGGLTSIAGFAEGVKQPFGQIVSQVARGIVTLDGAQEAAAAIAATEAEDAEVSVEDDPDVPADGDDVADGGTVAPQTTDTVEGALVDALDDGAEDPALAVTSEAAVPAPVEEDITDTDTEEAGDGTTNVLVPELDDGSLSDALLDMLDGGAPDGEADTTAEEEVV